MVLGQSADLASFDEEKEEVCVFDEAGKMTVQNARHPVLKVPAAHKKSYLNIPNRMRVDSGLLQADADNPKANLELGINGIKNLGNTCYINAALNCLFKIQPLSDYFLNDLHLQEINPANPLGSKGLLTTAFASLVKYAPVNRVSNSFDNCVIEPLAFSSTVQQTAKRFTVGEQEDAQEFLSYLLDTIHEDLNRVVDRSEVALEQVPEATSDPTSLEAAAKVSWKNHLKQNKSIIVDIFQGQIKSTLTCQVCSHKHHSFDPIMYYSLPFPPEAADPAVEFSLERLFQEYTKQETLEEPVSCGACAKKQPFFKKMDLWKSPNILIVHLKRFAFSQKDGAQKITNKVSFSLDNFDLGTFAKGYQVVRAVYHLFAVCVDSADRRTTSETPKTATTSRPSTTSETRPGTSSTTKT